RYRLLETIRQYARDRLLESGEAAAVRDRHLACFLSLAEQSEPELEGPALLPWLARLERDQDNFRSALGWSLSVACPASDSRASGRTTHDALPPNAEMGLRLAGALWFFWRLRDHWREGGEWLEGALLAAGESASKAARAKALLGLRGVLLDLGW